MMRRMVSGWVVLGLVFPAVAHSVARDVNAALRLGTSERRLADGAAPVLPPSTGGVSIEERIRFDGPAVDGELRHEYTFTGRENDLIVVYTESSDEENRGIYAELYDEDGQLIDTERNYEQETDLTEFRGRHWAFLFPTTGTYRLVVFAYENGFPTESGRDREYLLRVRVASEYEQLMVAASDMIDFELFQDALDLFTRAIEQRPDQPLPYFGRMYSQANLALVAAGLRKGDVEGPQGMYQLFQLVDADVQRQVLADLQKAQDTLIAIMAQENLTEDALDVDLAFMSAIAQYFTTGEPPEYLNPFIQKEDEAAY